MDHKYIFGDNPRCGSILTSGISTEIINFIWYNFLVNQIKIYACGVPLFCNSAKYINDIGIHKEYTYSTHIFIKLNLTQSFNVSFDCYLK